jgi:alpha-1,6-mannosyltransferase
VLDREQPDVVEGSSPWRGGWIAAHWQSTKGKRAVKSLFMHADPVAVYPQTFLGGALGRARVDALFGWFWAYLRRLNSHFDTTVVAGEWLARRFESFGLKDLRAVPMGVDRATFQAARRDAAARRVMATACGVSEDAALLISIGRHHPEKRLAVVMDAAARANAQRPVGLYLVGDGLARKAVERQAARLNAGGAHIHVAGQVRDRDHLAALMASADALIHGSASETYGIAVAEALCCGTPIIVPDAGGAADFADAAVGEMYPAGDGAAAGAAILRLLTRDPSTLRQAAAAKAAAKIRPAGDHFDKLFGLYEKLVADKRGA